MTALHLTELIAYRGQALFEPLTRSFGPGTLLGIVGPNGSGKSSLLAAITATGIRSSGTVHFGQQDLHRMPSRRRARVLAVMTQDAMSPNELRVRDVVGVGSHAGRGTGQTTGATEVALRRLGIEELANRSYATLSGGERQLVQVARVVAQDAPIMLFDEPTSALDLGHQLTVMHVLQERAASGHIVLVTMHDLTQALRWSTEVAVIAEATTTFGPPHNVITAELIRQVYGVTAEIFSSPTGSPTLNLVRNTCPTAAFLTPPLRNEQLLHT